MVNLLWLSSVKQKRLILVQLVVCCCVRSRSWKRDAAEMRYVEIELPDGARARRLWGDVD